MLLCSGSLEELPQPESSARTLVKGAEMDCGLNFKLRAFPTTESGLLFSSFPSLSLSLSHTQTYPLWLWRILVPNFFLCNSLPHTYPFISVIQQSFAKELLHFQSTGTPAFQQTIVFFDCNPDGCFRPRCLLWDTHTGSCFPSFFFGHQVSLCFSGHGNLSSKYILLNTETENIPTWKSDLGLLCLFLTAQVNQILHVLTACVLLAKRGYNILLLG